MEKEKRKIIKLIKANHNILIICPCASNIDMLGSALALNKALQKLNKKTRLILYPDVPQKFRFLLPKNPLSYEALQEKEFILSIKRSEKYIVFILGHPKIKKRQYFNNKKTFYNVPLIGIDNGLKNKISGGINLIDAASSSIAEIIIDLIKNLGKKLVDKEIANWALAALIDATENFHLPKTNSRSLNMAVLLINMGADYQKIIRRFYKTKSLAFLHLWGKVLPNMLWNKEKEIIWGNIKSNDFSKTKTSQKFVPKIIDEIKINFPNTKSILFFIEAKTRINGIIYSPKENFLNKLIPKLGGEIKNNTLYFYIPKQIKNKTKQPITAKKQVLDLINSKL